PACGAPVEVVYQQLHMLAAVPADYHTHDQAMFGVQRDIIPAVPLLVIVWVVAVAVLFLLADEGPLFVELDFAGLGGKKPPVRGGVAGHAPRPAHSSGPRCPYSPRRGVPFCGRPRLRRCGPRRRPLSLPAGGRRTGACPCVPRSGLCSSCNTAGGAAACRTA